MEIELYKKYEGFNTDVIKSGAVFHIKMVDNNAINGLSASLLLRTLDENILIIRSSPAEFEFITATDIVKQTICKVDYASVKTGLIDIKEMRELK